MASFTDSAYKFSPYISTQPVEAMVKVGMYKQGQYDENVQKIQGWIDSTSALPVSRDVDKQYLQSALNQAGDEINKLGNADFAEQQLTNSIGGMVGKISKDPNMIAAVQSTMHNQKQATIREELFKQGKTSISNDDDYSTAYSEYLNSTDLGRVFNHVYTPFTDVKKKAMEAIKAAHPQMRGYDIPFEVVNGKVNTRAIADAMQRYKIEGVDEAQIQAAITASLTPDDHNQLRIDAKYQFKGVTPEKLIENATINFNGQKAEATSMLKDLEGQRKITTDPNESAKIDARIDYYNKLLGKDGVTGILEQNYRANVEMAQTNPEAVKTAIYKDGFIKEFSNAFSWKNQEMQYVENPFKQMEKWRKEMQLKWTTENRQASEFNVNTKFKEKEIELKMEEIRLKKVELGGDPTLVTPIPLGNPTENENNADKIVASFQEQALGRVDQIKASLIDRGLTEKDITAIMYDYQNNTNNATKKPAWAINDIKEILKQQNLISGIRQMEDKAKTKARQDVMSNPDIKQLFTKMDEAKSGLNKDGRLQFVADGKTLVKSPSEIIDDINAGRASLRVDAAPLGKIVYKFTSDDGKSHTLELEKIKNSDAVKVFKKVNNFYNEHGKTHADVEAQIQTQYKKSLSPLANRLVPTILPITMGKNEEIPIAIKNNLAGLIMATNAKSIGADKEYDAATAYSFLEEKNVKDTKVFIHNNGDQYEVWIQNVKMPGGTQKLKMSGNDIGKYFGKDYLDKYGQVSQMLHYGRGSTNPAKNPDNAFMQKSFGDFPYISKLNVKADLDQDNSDPSLYIPTVFLKTKSGSFMPFEISGLNQERRLGYEQAIKNLNSLTDSELLQILKLQYPNFDYSTIEQ